MKIEMGKQYRTRDGREARVYAVDGQEGRSIHGAVKDDDGWSVENWRTDGRYIDGPDYSKCACDLVEVKPRIKRTYWVNVYPQEGRLTDAPYGRKMDADYWSSKDRIACVKIDIECEEGDGLAEK